MVSGDDVCKEMCSIKCNESRRLSRGAACEREENLDKPWSRCAAKLKDIRLCIYVFRRFLGFSAPSTVVA